MKLRKSKEKRKKNGMWLSKSARGLRIFRWGRGTIAAELCLLIMLVAGCSSIPATFHPKDPLPPSAVTHQLWHQVLEASVRDGHVNYPAIQRENRLDAYLRQLDRIDPASLPTRDEQLAVWINAYNAFAIQGILDGESPAPYVGDRKSTRLNSSHQLISYAVFCL